MGVNILYIILTITFFTGIILELQFKNLTYISISFGSLIGLCAIKCHILTKYAIVVTLLCIVFEYIVLMPIKSKATKQEKIIK